MDGYLCDEREDGYECFGFVLQVDEHLDDVESEWDIFPRWDEFDCSKTNLEEDGLLE